MMAGRAKANRRKGKAKGRIDTTGFSPLARDIVEGFQEAIDTLRSGVPLEERLTVRHVRLNLEPSEYKPADVARVRGSLGMSQAVFARFLGASAAAVRSWEQGQRPPSPMARRFLDEIAADPGHFKARLAAAVEVRAKAKEVGRKGVPAAGMTGSLDRQLALLTDDFPTIRTAADSRKKAPTKVYRHASPTGGKAVAAQKKRGAPVK
jgi:DNA-binding transcriptional regulator YiaG